jgi:hypothetical protein
MDDVADGRRLSELVRKLDQLDLILQVCMQGASNKGDLVHKHIQRTCLRSSAGLRCHGVGRCISTKN